MKRWVIGLVIGVLLMVLTRHQVAGAEPPSEWHPDVVDELAMDEWPVEADAMDEDERMYELEALEAERQEEERQLIDNSNNNNQPDFEEEEEDDVDQDDIEDEDEENNNEGTVYFEEDDVRSPQGSLDRLILPPPPPPPPVAPNPKAKPTTKLQQQEEQDLEVLDQSIVDTLQAALDVMKQDRPIRYIPPTNATITATTNPDKLSTSSPTPTLFMTVLHYLMYWTSYGSMGILLSMVILIMLRRYKVNQDKGVVYTD